MILLSDGIVLHFLTIDMNQSHDSVLISVPSLLPSACMHAKSLQSSPTLCDPMDHSPLGCSVHGILQARILEWVAISSSSGSSQNCVSCLLHWQAGSLPLAPSGKPWLLERKPHEAGTMSVLFIVCPAYSTKLEIE